MDARLYAEQQVLEKFNVKIEWKEEGNIREVLLHNVLAGDPGEELVQIVDSAHGMILAQNVLQPLDDYADLFQDEESSWMLLGKVFGHNYFLNDELRYGSQFNLYFNIGLIDRVPALKENGKTVLPVDLWLEGKWTWSVFEDYLQKIRDFYIGTDIYPLSPGYSAPLMAMHSNGGSAFGERGLEIDSPRTKEAVAWIERLMTKGLIYSPPITTRDDVGWRAVREERGPFVDGLRVFSTLPTWDMLAIGSIWAERGESYRMGVVPFPRPDNLGTDDPNYRQMSDVENNFAVLRGISPEMTELAVKVYREYILSYYRKMADSDRALDFLQSDQGARTSAILNSLDITNEDYGEKILEAWKFLGNNQNIKRTEYFRVVDIFESWIVDILGFSLFHYPGVPSYAVYVEQSMPVIMEKLNNIQKGLSSNGVVDNILPRFVDVEGSGMYFPVGTDPAEINWNMFFSVNDNVDGVIDISNVAVDLSRVNFASTGRYENAASFSVLDAAGNEAKTERTVIVFDGANTVPPSLVIRNGFRAIALNEDTSNINWRGDFVESATDNDGLDINDSVFADLSDLNTMEAGSYPVTIFVKDYAGNQASAQITVTVE
jgi:hypothetical protein